MLELKDIKKYCVVCGMLYSDKRFNFCKKCTGVLKGVVSFEQSCRSGDGDIYKLELRGEKEDDI